MVLLAESRLFSQSKLRQVGIMQTATSGFLVGICLSLAVSLMLDQGAQSPVLIGLIKKAMRVPA